MYEYLGIYDEEFIELHIVKIKASTREEADNKFESYLKTKLSSILLEDKMYVIPLFVVEEVI